MTTTTTNSAAYDETTIPSGWDSIPCVQYGFPENKGPIRSPKLNTIFEPIPDEVNTASPMYLLTPKEHQWQGSFENAYDISGTSSIGKKLQDRCESEDRVLYPIHIESDSYHEEDARTLIDWFREFTESWLDVSFNDCTLYFSGNRSIHVHVPRFVHGEEQRERLKEQAEEFCEETDAKLDIGLYSAKRMFRLPGVIHQSSTLPKVEIQPEWEHSRIISESTTANAELPSSYAEVLRDVFAFQGKVTKETAQSPKDEPHARIHPHLDIHAAVLELDLDESAVETPLIEGEYPESDADVPEWAMYNEQEFSPYAHGAGNPRSIAALRVKRGAFAKRNKRNGATMVPAYFYGAIGCNGEFTKEQVHAPLQLSKQDYKKWDATPGDSVVIIGGQSRNSLIHRMEEWDARVVGHALTGEEASRDTALDCLSDAGFHVGSAGTATNSSSSTGGKSTDERKHIWPARSNWQSPAEELQYRAEHEGIDTLTHTERARVAGRHLVRGWRPTWEWFKKQYGTDFKPEVTWNNLRNIVEHYDEYDHVDVPEKPQ